MVVGDVGARVIAAIVVMMIGAGADLVDVVEEEDVELGKFGRRGNDCMIYSDGVCEAGKMVSVILRYQFKFSYEPAYE